MLRKDPTSLGVDIQDDEIRIVQIRTRDRRAEVLNAVSAPLPAGSISRGSVQQPGAVALVFQRLLDQFADIANAKVAVAIPAGQTLMRVISLPPAPAAEIPTHVAGEVEYFQMVRPTGGSWAYLELERSGPDADTGTNVAVFAADQAVLLGLHQATSKPGLDAGAIEPDSIAAIRTLAATKGPESTFVLFVGSHASEITFIRKGRPAFYRRIDSGFLAFQDELENIDSKRAIGSIPALGQTPVFDSLSLELRRSLEYLLREYPEFAGVDKIMLGASSPKCGSLAFALHERLEVPVDIIPVGGGIVDWSSAVLAPAPNDRWIYACALGLAMRDLTSLLQGVARLDLAGTDHKPTLLKEHGSLLALSGALAAAGITIGLVAGVFYGNRATAIEAQSTQINQQAATIRAQVDAAVGLQARRLKQYDLLSREGVPLSLVADELTRGLQPGVGLSSIAITPDLQVNIGGDATTETSMIATLDALRASPLLNGLSITSFQRDQAKGTDGINFQVTGSTVSQRSVRSVISAPTGAERVSSVITPMTSAWRPDPSRATALGRDQLPNAFPKRMVAQLGAETSATEIAKTRNRTLASTSNEQ